MSNEPWPYKGADASGWPTFPPLPGTPSSRDTGLEKALFEAKLEVRKKRTDAEIAKAAAFDSDDLDAHQTYYEAVIEVAKGAFDRARSAADIVQKAAGAVVTIYAAVLGVAFSVSERPLPLRGLYPAIFLGLALVLSTAFVALLPEAGEETFAPAKELPSDLPLRSRLAFTFVRWSRDGSRQRSRYLRTSVIALGVGLAFLPAPFVSVGGTVSQPEAAVWPSPAEAAPGQPLALRRVLYQAQVNEAAAARDAKPLVRANEAAWFAIFMSGLALVVATLLLWPPIWTGKRLTLLILAPLAIGAAGAYVWLAV